jgi:hypothetical protein
VKEMHIPVQGTFRAPNRQNQKRNSPCHVILKMLSVQNKERILKVTRKKFQVNYKSKPIRITEDLLAKTLTVRTHTDVFQAPEQNNCQPKLLHPAKLRLNIKGKVNMIHDKHKLNQFMTTKPALCKILEEILHSEKE